MKKKVGLIIVAVIVIILICMCCSKKETKEETSKIERSSGAVTQGEAIKVDDKGKEETVKEEDKEKKDSTSASTASTNTAGSSNKPNSKATVKESSVTQSPSSSSSNDNASKPNTESTENKPTHTHNWVAVYGTRTIPVYESIRVAICDDCGAILSGAGGMSAEERSAHMNMHIDNGDKYGGGSHTETRKVQTGTTTEKYISSFYIIKLKRSF